MIRVMAQYMVGPVYGKGSVTCRRPIIMVRVVLPD